MTHWKEYELVMVPTKNQTTIFKKGSGLLEHNFHHPLHGVKNLGWKYQMICVVSDEKIKQNDWFVLGEDLLNNPYDDLTEEDTAEFRKITAWSNRRSNEMSFISEEVLSSIVEYYNKNGKLPKVEIEKESYNANLEPEYCTHYHMAFRFLVNSNNEINIRLKEEKEKSCKEVTGFETVAEFVAYQQGELDNQTKMLDYIQKWDGKDSNLLGAILNKTFKNQSEKLYTKEDMKRMYEAGRNFQISGTPTFNEMLNNLNYGKQI